MADNNDANINVSASDNSYDKMLKRIIERNKDLEEQLNKTKEAIESNNQAFNDADKSMSKYIGNYRNYHAEDLKRIKSYNQEVRRNNSSGSSGNKNSASSILDLVSRAGKMSGSSGSSAASGMAGLAKNIGSLAGVGATAAVAIGAVVGALVAMTKAGEYAAQQNQKLSDSYKKMGGSNMNGSTAVQDRITLGKQWDDFSLKVSRSFEPMFTGIVKATSKFFELIGISAKNAGLVARVSTKADVSAENKQLGFSQGSSNVMAANTYVLAEKMVAADNKQWGTDKDVIARDISSSTGGSKDIQKYGMVMDDATLKGYMIQEKGIDAVNVKVMDATLAQNRLGLISEQVNAKDSVAMQNKIQNWKKLGTMMEATKNQLFAFDEVINLTGNDFGIPELGNAKIDEDSLLGKDNKGQAIIGGNNPTSTVSTVLDPTSYNLVMSKLALLNNPITLPIGVAIGGYELLDNLVKKLNEIKPAYQSNIDILIPEYAKIGNVFSIMNSMPKEVSAGINIMIPQIALLREAYAMSESLNRQQVNSKEPNVFNKIHDSMLNTLTSISGFVQNNPIIEKASNFINSPKGAASAFGLGALAGVGGALAVGLGAGAEATTLIVTAAEQATTAGVGTADIGVGTADIAAGGILTRSHIANISEGNRKEAIIPLESSKANPAYEQIGNALGNVMGNNSSSGNMEIHMHLGENGIIIENSVAMNRFTETLANRIELLNRSRGNLNLGRG